MKFVVICVVLGLAAADLPRFRPARFRSQRIELAPTTTDSPTEATTESGPYPPSGWKPSGAPFTLPNETPDQTYGPPEQTYGPPEQTYGPPEQTYGPPQQAQSGPYPPSGWKPDGPAFELPQKQTPPPTSYGVPDNTYGVPTTDAPTTENPQAEKLEGPVDVQKSIGTYYVLLPNGQLQKVDFATENDIQNMRYTARLQYRERAPLLLFRP